jgi:hypothetical protein
MITCCLRFIRNKILDVWEVLMYIFLPNLIPGSSRNYVNMPLFIHRYAIFALLILLMSNNQKVVRIRTFRTPYTFCHIIISQLVPIFELNEMTVRMSLKKNPLESYLLGYYQTFYFEIKKLICFHNVESYQQSHALLDSNSFKSYAITIKECSAKASFMHFLVDISIKFIFSFSVLRRYITGNFT